MTRAVHFLRDDVQELVLYLTMMLIVVSWMLREIHIAFFSRSRAEEGLVSSRRQSRMSPRRTGNSSPPP